MLNGNLKNRNRYKKVWKIIPVILFFPSILAAQQKQKDTSLQATLPGCVQYALKHQPVIQESLIDEKITEESIKTRLADWYPQVNLDASYQNNIQLATSYFNGNYVNTGTHNISGINLSATQNIFNKDVLLATRTATDVRTGSKTNNNR